MRSLWLQAPATVHWGVDGWREVADTRASDTGLGVQVADHAVGNLSTGQHVDFAFRRSHPERWEAQDCRMDII